MNEINDFSGLAFDSHMHTPLCKHAFGEPSEYGEAAIEAGLDGIIFTCHSPMPNRWSENIRMNPEQFDEYVRLIEGTRERFEGRLEIRLGMESDWFPGMERWIEELHQRADFHFCLGSVHPHTGEYRQRFCGKAKEDPLAVQRAYFYHLAEAAETGLYDSLAHPDLIKNEFHSTWDFEAVREDVANALDRIAKTGVAMELNTSGLQKPVQEMNPTVPMLRMMAKRSISVTLGSDSHKPWRIGADFPQALDKLADAGFSEVHVFRKRKPHPIAISDFKVKLETAQMAATAR